MWKKGSFDAIIEVQNDYQLREEKMVSCWFKDDNESRRWTK